MPNKNSKHRLLEGLEYRDLEGMLKPTLHVDEFASNMGDDDDIITLSFFVRDKQAASDLVSWFEKGYDFVLDADRSPGEIKPNRYLVYVEIRRRSRAPEQIEMLLNDLNTLTEFDVSDWMIHHENQKMEFSQEAFAKMIPLTPDQYRQQHQKDLNEVREAAGLPVKKVYQVRKDMRELQDAAGIKR